MKRSRRKSPLKRGTKRMKRSKLSRTSRLAPIGRRRKREQKQGKRYGELADHVAAIGRCQAAGELPGPCGAVGPRKSLERCHALTRGAGYGDWYEHEGEVRGNLLLMCSYHHDYADNHKAETGEWMKRVARENGVAAIAAGVEPVL